MCPPACSDRDEERTVSDRGLTGHLISTFLGVTCNAFAHSLPECSSHGVVRLTPGFDGRDTVAGRRLLVHTQYHVGRRNLREIPLDFTLNERDVQLLHREEQVVIHALVVH